MVVGKRYSSNEKAHCLSHRQDQGVVESDQSHESRGFFFSPPVIEQAAELDAAEYFLQTYKNRLFIGRSTFNKRLEPIQNPCPFLPFKVERSSPARGSAIESRSWTGLSISRIRCIWVRITPSTRNAEPRNVYIYRRREVETFCYYCFSPVVRTDT